jgi:hypothetical protein
MTSGPGVNPPAPRTCQFSFVDVRVCSSVANSTTATSSTTMSLSILAVPRIIDVADVVHQNLTLDTAKNCVLVYFFAGRVWKLFRHVRARGFFRSIKDIYIFIAQVRTSVTLPSAQLNTRLRELFTSSSGCPPCARKWTQSSMLRGLT